jgi:SAM-dependent methyltransferase
MNKEPDYTIHEDRYRERRDRRDVYAGWFTERDYENGMREFEESMKRGFAPRRGRLIDLGCGAGNYSVRLAKLGYDVTGVDISRTAIEWASESLTGDGFPISFVCGDGVTLSDFEDEKYDFAFDGHFLHCIIGSDREVFLRNVHRILRPRGFLMIRSIVWPVASGGGLEVDASTNTAYLDGTPYRYYPEAEDLKRELEHAGFDVLDWRYTVTLSEGYGFQHAVFQCLRA